jgi:hypothetical protein
MITLWCLDGDILLLNVIAEFCLHINTYIREIQF